MNINILNKFIENNSLEGDIFGKNNPERKCKELGSIIIICK